MKDNCVGMENEMEEDFTCYTEEDALKYEQTWMNSTGKYRCKEPELIEQMDRWIQEGTLEHFIEIRHDQEFWTHYSVLNNVAYMLVAAMIYEDECKYHTSPCIFDIVHSTAETVDYLIELKFLLWHVEFSTQPDAKEQFMTYVLSRDTSESTIRCLVRTAGFYKVTLLITLADMYWKSGRQIFAFHLLQDANSILPGDEQVLIALADACLQAEQTEAALNYLQQIERPSEQTSGFIEQLKKLV